MKKNFLLFIISLLGTASVITAQQTKTPNIIFIFADDLGYGEVGCYGQQKIETPNMDQLAANGIRFTRFYSGSTVCAPARCSFLTGKHTGHTVIRGNLPFAPEGQIPLPDSVKTVANLLQQQGYATAAFGKWGLGFNQNSGDPNLHGFDRFYGYNCQSIAHDYYPPYIWDNHTKIEFPENKTKDSTYSAAVIHREAIRYIQSAGNKPFFLYLPYTIPHGDIIGPHDSLYNYYVKKFGEAPLTGNKLKTPPQNMVPEPYPHAQFAAMVARLDQYVGEIIETVKAKGLADNTLIIFSSDNGPHRENGGDPVFFNSSGIYRGIKRDLYEGGIRVPFMAYWPGKIKPGISEEPAALWDLYPTILELTGIKQKNNSDGYSLLPVLLNKGKRKTHTYFYWEFHENNGRQAVSWKNWKAIRLNASTANPSPIELYDLSTDPGEKNNLAEKYPAIVMKMEKWMREAHVPDPGWPFLFSEKNKTP